MSGAEEQWDGDALRLVCAHHGDQQFYELGNIEHETTSQRLWDFLAADPATECCCVEDSHHDVCWLVDQISANGDLYDTREVTREQAEAMLGRSLDDALSASRARLDAVYEYLATRSAS